MLGGNVFRTHFRKRKKFGSDLMPSLKKRTVINIVNENEREKSRFRTNESTVRSCFQWVKPEELTLYEQHQQKLSAQQPQNQQSLQAVPTQQLPQSQQPQLPMLFRHTEHLQHPPFSSDYQASRGVGNQTAQEAAYPQLQVPPNSIMDPSRFQQGFQTNQDWAWKANSGGECFGRYE